MADEPLAESEQSVRAWFERVVTDNYRLLFTVAYRILDHAADAEEAAQEAVLKGFQSLPTLKKPEGVVAWLAQIVRNTAFDMRRKGGKTRVASLPPDALAVAAPAEPEPAGDLHAILREEWNGLPEAQALVLTLRFQEDLDVEEIGRRLGITPNYARQLLFRARNRLRRSARLRRALAEDVR